MTKPGTLLTSPELDTVATAYAGMRDLGITPLVAHDWLIEHVHTVTREDVAEQLARNSGQPVEDTPPQPDERLVREIARTIHTAVTVYNRRRPRITAIDNIATESGAAAINRAAVIRQARANDTALAATGTIHVDTVAINKTEARHYVAATLYVGGTARALSARFTSNSKAGARLTHFDILMP